MSDGDAPPTHASDPAGSGRAHGAGEPRRFPTAMERLYAHNVEKLRRWALAHPDPLAPPQSDDTPAPEPDASQPEPARPAGRARATQAPADQPGRVLRWLPASLQRLYRRLIEAPALRAQDPPPAHPAGRRGARLRPRPAFPAGDRLRRVLRAPPAAEGAVPPQPGPPRPHLVVRRAEQQDRPPPTALPPLRDRPRPLHRGPRHRRLGGRGRALPPRPPRHRPPGRRAAPIPRAAPAVLGAPPRARRPQRPGADAAAVRARALADDRPSRLARILAPSRPTRRRARPAARPRPSRAPPDPAPPRTPARHRSRTPRCVRQPESRVSPG